MIACSVTNASTSCDSLSKWMPNRLMGSNAARATQDLVDRRSKGLNEESTLKLELSEATAPISRGICLDRGGPDPAKLYKLAEALSRSAPRRCIDLSILDEALIGLNEHRIAQLAPSVVLKYFDEGKTEPRNRTICELDRETLLQDEAVLRQVAGTCRH